MKISERWIKRMGIRCEDMVFTHQTHTINVRVVTEADRGCGIDKTLGPTRM